MPVIEVKELVKRYKDIEAVRGISFKVEEGEIFGFLGPNGAGKTTVINILSTLLKPTSGEVFLGGFNVVKQPGEVRKSIGLVFQDTTLDEHLTAWENLYFHALLYGVNREIRKERIERALKMVELENRKRDLVKTFSGGMKRRLEIARGFLHYPKVLFLDEPTVGLDPQTRNHIWKYIRELREKENITIFLTTHYMDEAENCDRIAIIDHGVIVAEGTTEELKRQVGGDVITFATDYQSDAALFIKKEFGIEAKVVDNKVVFEAENGEELIPLLVSRFKRNIKSISLRRPTLDDVFLKITGRALRDETVDLKEQMRMRRRARRRR
ncbi:MAG TPA: ABC transporter ATP-binding protein [Peptococcaceae bacterium]|nr:MAG: Daunorubicin resistance ABC transporter ATP-binding subunit [Clostridia bacterium 41_269]HBT19860.1 ABC transporter ATP-binding protein [Peptococcaceae bacterium]